MNIEIKNRIGKFMAGIAFAALASIASVTAANAQVAQATAAPAVAVAQVAPNVVAVQVQGEYDTEYVQVASGVYVAHQVPAIHIMPRNVFTDTIRSVASSVLSVFRWVSSSCWDLVHRVGDWFYNHYNTKVDYSNNGSQSATCVITFLTINDKCTITVTRNYSTDIQVTSK